MSAVLLDTVGLIALWDKRDQWHAAATAAIENVPQHTRTFVTTSFVLLECGNAAARRPYRSFVTSLRQTMESSGRIIVPTELDWQHAWAAYERGNDSASIVDHVSFVIMRRQGITIAFTNDRHFSAAGFQIMF